ncbi:MAG: hypothetical protein HUU38_20100, partial [Anaerolineales bacterium]|nr:hypothetical protein [Anaerolineales bacterium]
RPLAQVPGAVPSPPVGPGGTGQTLSGEPMSSAAATVLGRSYQTTQPSSAQGELGMDWLSIFIAFLLTLAVGGLVLLLISVVQEFNTFP